MVADAAGAAEAVVAAGGTIMLPAAQYGTEVLATFLDPAGNLLGIYEQPGLAQSEAETNR
jgi:predicted enzyme related to lactoylglutathione lyase